MKKHLPIPDNKKPDLEEPMAFYGSKISSSLAFLGFTTAQQIAGKFDFINLIRSGISRKALDHLMDVTGISAFEMAGIFHTSDRTLRRYTPDTILNPEQSERAIELARLYSRGEEVFGTLDAFKNWMDSQVISLGNKKPKEFLDTSLGIELIVEELGRIEHGVFA